MSFAASQNRVIYTKNAGDFARLHSEWQQAARSHSGIIVVSEQQTPIGVQLRALTSLATTFGAEDMADRLVFLLNYV